MNLLLDSLAQRDVVFLTALALLAISIVVLARLHVKSERRWGSLLRGADGSSLQAMLQEHLAEKARLEAEVESLGTRLRQVEEAQRSAKRHVGLVRFDAFDGIGGSQSFAVAIIDERGDGLILSSLVGREMSRVYAKSIVGGRSERELSGEERRALREAVESPRAVVGA